MVVLRVGVVVACLALSMALLPSPASAQATGAPGTLYLSATPAVVGATVPCDSATYTLVEEVPAAAKAYMARSFGGSACTTNLDFLTPRAFVATAPVTVRAVIACDQTAVSGGVQGATTSMRFVVLHGTKNLSGNVNLVGSNTCNATPIVFQANIDLKGEAFAAGDLLRVQVIPFYTSGGAGDPVKSLHLKAGGADPTHVFVPDLATSAGGTLPTLHQNVTGPELRVGRDNATALDQVEVYNWTAAFLPRLAYSANITGGQVAYEVLAGNTSLTNRTVSATGNATEDLSAGGNLTLRLTYANFTGTFVLSMVASPAGSGANGTSTSHSGTAGSHGSSSRDASSGDGTADGDATGAKDEEAAPGPSGVTVVLLVALAVLVARRRQP